MENETNKSYRIRTNINKDSNVLVNFTQEYETFELLSIKMKTDNLYRLHNANYGIIVGRVQANGGFGVPNAKISIFLEVDQENENSELLAIYGYTDVFQTNSLGNTYNLLPDEQVSDCHKKIGAFPSKRYLLDNETYIEVFDKYYKYTTRTNDAGDYILVGIPVGNQTLHMDLDLSDCGILSQRPRDFVYKGYNIEQFDNPNQFKSDTGASINFLSQYVQQTKTVYVNPLWGNNELGETLGITRADIDVNFKFEPTCVFMGSIVSDSRSNGISMKCVPTDQMGVMDELTTGKGTIEMIRKTPTGDVEEFQIKGNELIDGNGTWCYQIPMNLDYVTTNEYGEIVATDNPNIGIPTRARVRFRVSLDNFESSNDNYFAGKVLVPNNPKVVTVNGIRAIDYDYSFGTNTNDDSYRDLFWNNVYSVKQHIPRVQKSGSWRTDRFTGIKQCNFYGQNNPIPYNSIRIKLPFMFVVLCAIIKTYVRIVAFLNAIINAFFQMIAVFMAIMIGFVLGLYPVIVGIYAIMRLIKAIMKIFGKPLDLSALEDILALNVKNWPITKKLKEIGYITIADGICPDLESWYFAPALLAKGIEYCPEQEVFNKKYNLCSQTIDKIMDDSGGYTDKTSTDSSNKDTGSEKVCITKNLDYLMTCIEMNLAQEYKVIKFDFYNDWINGMLYIPRWKFRPAHKITFLFGLIKFKVKTKGCFDDSSIFGRTRWLTQHCALGYDQTTFNGGYKGYSKISTKFGCSSNKKRQKCHKNPGIRHTSVFGWNGGVVHQEKTMLGQTVYYYKPSEMSLNKGSWQTKINMFATDIVLLGSLKDCDENGIPQSFKWLSSSSYKMPTNLALTNLDEAGVVFVDDGSYCRGGNNGDSMESRSVGVAENSFSGQVEWSSTAPMEIQIMGYNGSGQTSPNGVEDVVNVASDRIALTEAAGISWDYTGPSQAGRDVQDLFSPGGHFLGMSCINSKTNIKSCVNLQRICEAGVTMSERIERTRGLKLDSNNQYKQQFVVFSPNGFISTDEVIAGSFRNMFATLNLRPLIATKKDENTGYLTYDFKYVRANGFEGGAEKNIVSQSMNYNRNIEYTIPKDFVYESSELNVDDYDDEEREHTYHRSIEATNFGYYRFRFGLSESNVKRFNAEADTKYALSYYGKKYLPQYENSFYFYFGLKDGNTALDRLYSDFFSMCPTRQRPKKPSIKIKDAGFECCTREQSIFITCDDIEYPYDITMTSSDGATVNANNVMYKTVNICGLQPGEWTISVTDNSGFSVIKKVNIGSNMKGIEYEFTDFKERLGLYHLDNATSRLVNGDNYPNGGEFKFKFDNLTVFGSSIDEFRNNYGIDDVGLLFISSEKPNISSAGNIINAIMLRYNGNKEFKHIPFNRDNFYNSSVMETGQPNRHKTDFEFGDTQINSLNSGAIINSEGEIGFYLWGDKLYYTLYFIFKCGGEDLYAALSLHSFYSQGYEMFNVYLGSKYLKYNGKNSEGFTLSAFLNNVDESVISLYDNLISKINSCGGDKAITTQWALRQALFDQRYDITVDSSDRLIRCTNLNGEFIDGILLGQPERAVQSGENVKYEAFSASYPLSENAYMSFPGYDIDDTASLLPSVIAFDRGGEKKLPYYKMSYDSENGIVLSEPIGNIKIHEVKNYDNNNVVIVIDTPLTRVKEGRAYILQSKTDKDVIIECSYIGENKFIIPKKYWENLGINIENETEGFDIMPTLLVPIIHRPFYFESYPFMLGQFTATGTSTLNINIEEASTSDATVSCHGADYQVTQLTYGDRILSYKLYRDSDKKNRAHINNYMKIYGGNACAPNYYLSEDCSLFGEKISGITIGDTITGTTKDSIENIYSVELQEQTTPIEVSLSTGIPDLDTLGTKDKEELTAFIDGDELKGLNVTTSYSVENFLPKEIVIKKKRVKVVDADPKVALIKEDRYLDVGDLDEYTAKDVNKNVKLYMIVIPDNGASDLSSKMQDCIFDENMLTNNECIFNNDKAPSYHYYNDNSKHTLKDLLSPITLSDYFSNPQAVAFLFDQVINSAHLSMAVVSGNTYYLDDLKDKEAEMGRIHGGYFKLPIEEDHITPGLLFGHVRTYTNYNPLNQDKVIEFILKSPFLKQDDIFRTDPSCMNMEIYESRDGIIGFSNVSGCGSNEYADISTCLKEAKRDRNNNTLIDYLKGNNLYNGMKKFGFDLDVVYKYNVEDENKYPDSDTVASNYCDILSQSIGETIDVGCLPKTFKKVFKLSYFDKIIGRNWSFPNIEYVVNNENIDKGVYSGFSKNINDEYERIARINESKSNDGEKETPNYAKIIAKYFIDDTYDIETNEAESETLKKLFRGAENSNESFIVPIVLGENRDGNGELKSSFMWPGESDKYTVNRDKTWVVNKTTKYALGHDDNERIPPASTIEESIYAENLSYGFRSIIVGIYDGPEDGDNSFKDTENKTGNIIRPFKIYTYHHKGTDTYCNSELSRTSNSHYVNDEYMPNDYYNRRESETDKQKVEHLRLYYYHTYENDYDQYASGWC